MRFDELALSPEVLKAVSKMGYLELTPIQEQTFALIRAGRDLVALAETGSGKTSACAIPLAEMVDPRIAGIQALILVPTRELALQYVDELDMIGRHTGISSFAIYGGFSMEIQKAKLAHGVHILVATPGRLIDHLYNSTLTLEQVRTVVLDEADEMLKMGFVEDVNFILSCIMNEHQTLLFSATMPGDVEELANSFLTDPARIELNREEVSPQSISHRFRYISDKNRLQVLKHYLEKEKPHQAIIFCNSKRSGHLLYRKLKGVVESLEYIHGGLDQATRTSIFNRFKKGMIQVMIATDVAGRGLDFSRVSHIFNYDFPVASENYVHRTGRMGREGIAISLVTGRDLPLVRRLFKEKGIQGSWDGKVPDLKRRAAKKGAGSKGRKPGAKPSGRRRKTSAPVKKAKSARH
ncbi:MAG: DEAD/DEAH box helicase [Desulfobulbales bacterium]|nr:DEAD/DEAH box helicase [Desulfobulbales bacterium]